jgi:hypothetical protein
MVAKHRIGDNARYAFHTEVVEHARWHKWSTGSGAMPVHYQDTTVRDRLFITLLCMGPTASRPRTRVNCYFCWNLQRLLCFLVFFLYVFSGLGHYADRGPRNMICCGPFSPAPLTGGGCFLARFLERSKTVCVWLPFLVSL